MGDQMVQAMSHEHKDQMTCAMSHEEEDEMIQGLSPEREDTSKETISPEEEDQMAQAMSPEEEDQMKEVISTEEKDQMAQALSHEEEGVEDISEIPVSNDVSASRQTDSIRDGYGTEDYLDMELRCETLESPSDLEEQLENVADDTPKHE